MMKILIGVAGMPYAEPTVHFGRLLVEATQAQVTVLTVFQKAEERQQAHLTLERAVSLLAGLTVEMKARQGMAATEILRETREGAYDLVTIGTRERPGFSQLLLGTVARRVVGHTAVPVVVVRGKPVSLINFLICTSGREYAEPVLESGVRLAKATDAHATILHVAAPIPAMYTGLKEMEEHLSDFLKTDTPEAAHLRHGAEILAQHGVPGQLRLRHGDVLTEILREIRRGNYDLVIIGASGATQGVRGYLLGDMTRKIIDYALRPVLVVPRGVTIHVPG